MEQSELIRVRDITLKFPEVTEKISHGAPCFFVQDKRPICYFHDHHRGDDRVSLWCPAYPDVREDLLQNYPARYFEPQPSASGVFSQWIGVYLDGSGDDAVDWRQVASLIEDAFRKTASKAIVARLDKS